MKNLYIKYWIAFAIAGMWVFMPSAARAEIPITGGRTAGDAAFFVPNTGNTLLFDVNTQILRLETPNGITVNSQFRPRGGRLDPVTGIPDGGETGFLEGTLSGRAFTAEGTPFFFQGVSTTLNFTLTSFDTNRVLSGTLVNPTGQTVTSLIFLEATGTSLSDDASENFEAIAGDLHIGEFSANLPNGSIDLPSDTQFAGSATEFINFDGNALAANADTKFELEGSGEGTTTVNVSEQTIRYESENATANFRIEGTVDGTPDNSNVRSSASVNSQSSNGESEVIVDENGFTIEGTIQGPVNFVVGGVDANSLESDRTYIGETEYQINGVGRGSTEFNNETGSLNFSSPESNTEVEITGDGFEFQGSATGEVSFNVGVGLSSTVNSTEGNNGQVFGMKPVSTSTDFGRGFQGLRALPTKIETPSNQIAIDNETILDNIGTTESTTADSDSENTTTDRTNTNTEPETPSVVPGEVLPNSDPDVSTSREPDVSTSRQPDVSTSREPEVSTSREPDVSTSTQPEANTSTQPEENVRRDPLAELIEKIRQQRSQPEEEPETPDFPEAVELHLMRLSGPRSRVFPGMETFR